MTLITKPPPPPPPPPSSGYSSPTYSPDIEVSSCEALIPANYSDDGTANHTRTVQNLPFRRNIFQSSHRAQATDFKEYEWLFKYASTETWYEKPSNALLKRMKATELLGDEADELPVSSAKPIEYNTPKVWTSAALTTPTDDDIYECTADHGPQHAGASYIRTCQQCTDAKSEALEATSLSYCLVFSSTQGHDFITAGTTANCGRLIYKLFKCGSREAAIAEVFHATGLNGWSLVFSCVMRADESIEERGAKFGRVDDLWMLADNDDDRECLRVFY